MVGQNIKEKNESKPGVLLLARREEITRIGPSARTSWSVSFSGAKLSSDHPVMGKKKGAKDGP